MPQKDPEARRAYNKAWREKNKDKLAANQKRYAEKNAEKVKEYRREYYRKNREKILKRTNERYKDPKIRQQKIDAARKWAEENPERVRNRARRYWAKKKYGLTLDELEAILARGCAICGAKEDPQRGDRRHGRLCIDHDHTNGKIRDALCHSCNAALGGFGDDPARLRAAADYLEQHLEV